MYTRIYVESMTYEMNVFLYNGIIELWERAVQAMLAGHPLRQPIFCLFLSPSGRRQIITA